MKLLVCILRTCLSMESSPNWGRRTRWGAHFCWCTHSPTSATASDLHHFLQKLRRELSFSAADKTKGDSEADRHRQQLSVVRTCVCRTHPHSICTAPMYVCTHFLQLQESWQQKEQRYEEEISATLVSVHQQVLSGGCIGRVWQPITVSWKSTVGHGMVLWPVHSFMSCYVRTNLHTYIRMYIHAYICTYVRTYVH